MRFTGRGVRSMPSSSRALTVLPRSVTLTQHPWRLRSREGHGSRIAGSGFVHSYCMMLLASFVALRLGNADFAQFMDFARWPWRPSIEPREP